MSQFTARRWAEEEEEEEVEEEETGMGAFLSSVWYGVLVCLLYRVFCFRMLHLGNICFSYQASLAILYGPPVVFALVSALRRKSVLPFTFFWMGLYALVTCRDILPRAGAYVLAAALLPPVLVAWSLLRARRRVFRRIRFFRRLLAAFRLSLWLALAAFLAYLTLNGFLGSSLVPAAHQQLWYKEGSSITALVDEDLRLQLREEVYQGLSPTERLALLQNEVYAAQADLDLTEPISLSAAILQEDGSSATLASYNPQTRSILLTAGLLAGGSAGETLDSLYHEVYHAYQQSCVDRWEDGETEGLPERTALYAEEFASYQSGNDGSFSAYYHQAVEEDARAYARDQVALTQARLLSVGSAS